ncbi:hypothetical protein Tco_0715218 [Tanacetum coccineum]
MGWMGMTDNLGEGISGRNSLSAEVCKLVENGSFWRKDEWKIAIDCEMMEKKQVALESSEVVGVEKPSQEANNSWLKDFSIRFYGWQLANKMYGLQLHHICLVKSWLSPQFMAWVKVWKTITSSIRLWGFMHDYPEQRRLAGQELSNPFIAMLLLKIIWFNQFIVSHSVFGFIQRTIKAHSDPVYKDLHSSSTTDSEVSDSEEENMSQTKTEKKTVKPSIAKIEFVKPKQQEKTARKTVKKGNPQMDLQDKGVIDSGCSRHMTGNMSYLTD